jgi:esterase/lipase superfamily enzyme
MALNQASVAQAEVLLKNNKGKAFFHSGAKVWIFPFADGTFFHSSVEFSKEKLKELEAINKEIEDGAFDDWF